MLQLATFHRGEVVRLIPISVTPHFPAGNSHGEQRPNDRLNHCPSPGKIQPTIRKSLGEQQSHDSLCVFDRAVGREPYSQRLTRVECVDVL